MQQPKEREEQLIKALETELAKPEQEPEQDTHCKHCNGIGCVACDARCLPEQELAKPEQEPQMIQIKDGQLSYIKKPWVGLTDDEVYEIANFCKDQPFNLYAKEIENKLKEKNA